MIDHLSSYSCDFEKSREFYSTVFKTLDIELTQEFKATWNQVFPTQRICAFGPKGQSVFWLIEVREAASPRHIAFTANNRDAVNTFYQAAINMGGKDNGVPGLRTHYHEHYYGAFVIDIDGNNIEAVCHNQE